MLSAELVWRLAAKPSTIRELCEATGSSRQHVHHALQRLLFDGYVENQPAPPDPDWPRPRRLQWKLTKP